MFKKIFFIFILIASFCFSSICLAKEEPIEKIFIQIPKGKFLNIEISDKPILKTNTFTISSEKNFINVFCLEKKYRGKECIIKALQDKTQ